ncbi:MAG TPA: threonine--tRNA ligase [Longimicrobium sp.]|jgi:threonyl-tRNA synthetase|nr:threonine--tRNA ligase [Longimicrobium sp.]
MQDEMMQARGGAAAVAEPLAARVDGRLVDLASAPDGAEPVGADDAEALPLLRHSAAHLLAAAVRALRPEAGIGFGPAIEDGFYYDFAVDRPFTPADLAAIEEKMRELAAADEPFQRREVSRDEARALFADDPLKLERLEEIGDDEVISVYRNGAFLDLCRGPHVPSTGHIRHFRLLSAAGAYWRGDERRPMLQRIYGTAWASAEQLEAHLARLEEAKRRDHRVLGQALDLFSVDPRIGPGLILWHPRGTVIRDEVERYERELIRRHGYEMVSTPHLQGEALFAESGHLQSFDEGLWGPVEVDGRRYRPKPMNCPGHIAIYQNRVRSYRELPLRWAEFGAVYRAERGGVLHGMLRVRGFTQDDAHVFCTPEQLPDELGRMLALVDDALSVFGYAYSVELATRPEKAIGDPARWEHAQALLADTLRARGMEFAVDEGGGAFYGPKLDFKLMDALGRRWQGPTVQLDFNLPERFGMEYTGPDNRPHRPVMLHRVLLGSTERFVGGLIEHYGGAFPVWLAPVQAAVIPVREEHEPAARALADALRAAGLRPELVRAEGTLAARVRHAETMKVPYIAVLGGREAEAGTVSVRRRGGREAVSEPQASFVARLREEYERRA